MTALDTWPRQTIKEWDGSNTDGEMVRWWDGSNTDGLMAVLWPLTLPCGPITLIGLVNIITLWDSNTLQNSYTSQSWSSFSSQYEIIHFLLSRSIILIYKHSISMAYWYNIPISLCWCKVKIQLDPGAHCHHVTSISYSSFLKRNLELLRFIMDENSLCVVNPFGEITNLFRSSFWMLHWSNT